MPTLFKHNYPQNESQFPDELYQAICNVEYELKRFGSENLDHLLSIRYFSTSPNVFTVSEYFNEKTNDDYSFESFLQNVTFVYKNLADDDILKTQVFYGLYTIHKVYVVYSNTVGESKRLNAIGNLTFEDYIKKLDIW